MFFDKSVEETKKLLGTDLLNGLSKEEAEKRLKEFGENKLTAKKSKSIFTLFFEQLNDILIYILLAAALISSLLGEISDTVIILIVVILNAVIGVIQESKAEKALDALKKLSSPKAVVKRDGELIEIPSEEVVTGDIVIIDAGRYIPCDLRLVETVNLKIDESALTGESLPSEKDSTLVFQDEKVNLGDQKNMAFSSTLSTYGRGAGIAVYTGMNTEIGKIATMLQSSEREETPLQKKLSSFGKVLGIGILCLCTVMFLVGIGEQYLIKGSVAKKELFEMFLTSISLAVAAIPEGLPAIVTIVLAIGVQKMIKRNAIVRKLPAVETLGSVNVICSDKTGTLTQNQMTVVKFYTNDDLKDIKDLDINDVTQNLLLNNIILCNDATYSQNSKTGDPTEIALLEAGVKFNIFKDDLSKEHERVNEIPFDSERKLMTTVNKYNQSYYVMTKGAMDNLLKISSKVFIDGHIVPLTEGIKSKITKASNLMANDALRVLGAAVKVMDSPHIEIDNLETDLVFLGLVGMIDPPRQEVKPAIEICKKAGIKTIMITGDHKNTAMAIAKELKIASEESESISGLELDSLSEEDLYKSVEHLKVFARVSPEHKVRIVKAFKANGNVVSMTGDGVNDAPSLKNADIGVAMGITGTDVAKGAADMILTDDNFSTIVKAIEEGRNIYNNIRKSILFLLSCNTGEIVAIFLSILLGWASPLKPIHILWVNLITDTLPALSLGADLGDPGVMNDKPRNPKESLFAGGAGLNTILNGILIGFLTLSAYVIGAKVHSGNTSLFPLFPKNISEDSLIFAQTMAFVVLSVSQLFHSLNMRHPKKSIFQVGFFSNKLLIMSIIIGIFMQDIVITVPFLSKIFKVVPLTLNDWILVSSLSVTILVINEIAKVFIRLKEKRL